MIAGPCEAIRRSIRIARANCAFEFQKRSQLFIRTHNETPSIAAMRISNPDCAPA
jgi:hypothetical protein